MQSTSRPSSSSPPSLPAVSPELLSSSLPTNAPESSSRDLAPKQNQFTINAVLFDENKKTDLVKNLPANGDQLATLRGLSKFLKIIFLSFYQPPTFPIYLWKRACKSVCLPQIYTPTYLRPACLFACSGLLAYLPQACMPICLPQAYTPTCLLFEPRPLSTCSSFMPFCLPTTFRSTADKISCLCPYLKPVYLRAYLRNSCLRAYLKPVYLRVYLRHACLLAYLHRSLGSYFRLACLHVYL